MIIYITTFSLDSHKYEVLDVAGQNLFAGKRDQYYKDIKGAIIMYDVMNWSSYDNVTDVWLKELKEKAPSGTPFIVVGNKMENRDTRKVSVEVVAEAISNTFEPKGIGYCEISVKTNQNLAEPFLFLTKKILNIHDNKALYFVSKISELNLIESMLQHKKSKDDKEKQSQGNNVKPSPKSQNLDNLFLNDSSATTSNKNNGANKAKGGDYLDDIIFKIGDDNTNKSNDNINTKASSSQSQLTSDDNFLAEMMGNAPITKSKSHEAKVIAPPKTSTVTTRAPKIVKSQSISPKNANQTSKSTSLSRSQSESRNRASSSTQSSSTTNNSNSKNRKSNQQSRRVPAPSNNDQSVVVDILLGLQETLNNLQSDVRRLQNDVSYLKQEFQKGKSQRR